MAEITTELIKELRDKTSVSVMQCKKALEEAGGDMEKALMILKKQSAQIAEKKSEREAHSGLLVSKKDNSKAVILSLNCETDFVAKNEDFVNLADTLVNNLLKDGADKVKEDGKALIDSVIQKVGENIVLGEVKEIEGKTLGIYVHDGKIATIVSLGNTEDETLAKDIAMHITAMNPEFKNREDIPQSTIDSILEISKKEVEESDKPEEIKIK